jgi:hypothetical protein
MRVDFGRFWDGKFKFYENFQFYKNIGYKKIYSSGWLLQNYLNKNIGIHVTPSIETLATNVGI